MIAILSPAKNMKTRGPLEDEELNKIKEVVPRMTQPFFTDQAQIILELMKNLDTPAAADILGINENLAAEALANWKLFKTKATLQDDALPALSAFNGIAYQYLDAITLTKDEWDSAQNRIRTIDATFGALRPKDAVLPHRLDFSSKLKINNKNLYEFWGSSIAKKIEEKANGIVVDVSSQEYSKAVLKHLSNDTKIISCNFYSTHNGKTTQQATWAKMARGSMARFIAKNAINDPVYLKDFDYIGFQFIPEKSSDTVLTFLNDNPSVD